MENGYYLQHHGIKGMKWGIRRFQNKDGSLTAAGKKRRRNETDIEVHDDHARAHQSKRMESMSDAELRNRINRLQMEKQYSQLSEDSVSKGKDYMNKVIKAGTTVATVTTTALTIYNNADKIKKIVEGIIKK